MVHELFNEVIQNSLEGLLTLLHLSDNASVDVTVEGPALYVVHIRALFWPIKHNWDDFPLFVVIWVSEICIALVQRGQHFLMMN